MTYCPPGGFDVLRSNAIRTSLLIFFAAGIGNFAKAAEFNGAELARMSAEAARYGVTPITVNLFRVKFRDVEKDRLAILSAISAKKAALLQELGNEALLKGHRDNQLGQLGLFVTANGLKILQSTSNALAFWPGTSDALNGHRLQQGFREVEIDLNLTGWSDVVLHLRSELSSYEIQDDGSITVSVNANAVSESRGRIDRVVGAISGIDVANWTQATLIAQMRSAQGAALTDGLPLRINRRGLMSLIHHPDVARIVSAGYQDRRGRLVDPAAPETARRLGKVEVLITMRDPSHFHALSPAEYSRRTSANSRAFKSLLAAHNISKNYKDISEFGAISIELTATELKSLINGKDRRILEIAQNKPMGQATLNTSTVQMNLPQYWNADAAYYPEVLYPDAGFKGAYPSIQGNPASPHIPIKIIVLDSGVEKNHAMLSGKVVWEACFGTNFDQPATQLPGAPLIPDTKFRSICRSATGSPLIFGDGDSPLNLLNSGEPSPDGLNCASSFMGRNSGCGHGTHVAGIAAGRTNGITGVSPAAKIVSVQIFSFDSNPVFSQRQAPSWFLKDLLLALQAILPFAPVGGKNDLVTTMSIGNLLPVKVPCTSGSVPGSESPRFTPGAPALEAFVLAMNALKAGEVPVIAAAGNDYVPLFGTLFPGPNGLAFPACLPNVIKVGAALNLPIGGQQAGYSNAPDLSLFPRETYWIAPGGGGSDDYSTVGVRSAWIAPGSDGTPYKNLSGTSMAAPHVAGLYANIMAGFRKFNIPFTIQGASDWIRGSGGSFPVDWQFGGVNATYEAIRLHDLAQ